MKENNTLGIAGFILTAILYIGCLFLARGLQPAEKPVFSEGYHHHHQDCRK